MLFLKTDDSVCMVYNNITIISWTFFKRMCRLLRNHYNLLVQLLSRWFVNYDIPHTTKQHYRSNTDKTAGFWEANGQAKVQEPSQLLTCIMMDLSGCVCSKIHPVPTSSGVSNYRFWQSPCSQIWDFLILSDLWKGWTYTCNSKNFISTGFFCPPVVSRLVSSPGVYLSDSNHNTEGNTQIWLAE